MAEVPQSREQMSLTFAPVVKHASPAVVNIYTQTRIKVQSNASPFMNDPFFRQFFGDNPALGGGLPREKVVNSLGSGVLIQADGMIVTSHHVIRDAQAIRVVLADKREFEAKVVRRDTQSDLAFLKIEANGPLPYLEMRDSDSLEVGDLVLAIGNPFGVGQTVTQGIISALARKAVGVSDYQFFIQTDAAINPGNSGGALVDMQGKLIGINTAIYSQSGGSLGIGFAIPANMVRTLLEGKVQGGKLVRPWIGLSVQPVTSEIAQSLGMPSPRGVIVRKVIAASPAAAAGLKVGDVVLSVGKIDVSTEQEIQYRVALSRIGDKSEFDILRNGQPQKILIEMQAAPETVNRDERALKGSHPLNGMTVANLSPALAVELELADSEQEGVVIVNTTGAGPLIPLAVGDIIMAVNGVKITSTAALDALLKKAAHAWKIVYKRGNNIMTLSVRM